VLAVHGHGARLPIPSMIVTPSECPSEWFHEDCRVQGSLADRVRFFDFKEELRERDVRAYVLPRHSIYTARRGHVAGYLDMMVDACRGSSRERGALGHMSSTS
jgi:hypothetical protein